MRLRSKGKIERIISDLHEEWLAGGMGVYDNLKGHCLSSCEYSIILNQNTEENYPAHLFLIVTDYTISLHGSFLKLSKLSQLLPFHHIHQSFFYWVAIPQVEHPNKRMIKTARVHFYSI
jgi:hypothetical protein